MLHILTETYSKSGFIEYLRVMSPMCMNERNYSLSCDDAIFQELDEKVKVSITSNSMSGRNILLKSIKKAISAILLF